MKDAKNQVLSYPDFPKPGVLFYDLSGLLMDPASFKGVIDDLAAQVQGFDYDVIVAVDARGFIFGAALALQVEKGLAIVRKPGKLPGAVNTLNYTLEYGSNSLSLQKGLLKPGMRALIIDDVLATGGTAFITSQLIEAEGAIVTGLAFVLEIAALNGRALLPYPIAAWLTR